MKLKTLDIILESFRIFVQKIKFIIIPTLVCFFLSDDIHVKILGYYSVKLPDALSLISSFIIGLLNMWLYIGSYVYFLKLVRNEKSHIGDLFICDWSIIKSALILSILSIVLIFPFFLIYAPLGIIFIWMGYNMESQLPLFTFLTIGLLGIIGIAMYFTLDRQEGAFESIKSSFKYQGWRIYRIYLILCLPYVLAMLAQPTYNLITIITYPLFSIVLALYYLDITKDIPENSSHEKGNQQENRSIPETLEQQI